MPNVENMALSAHFSSRGFTTYSYGIWALLGRSVIYTSVLFYASVKNLSLTYTRRPNIIEPFIDLNLSLLFAVFQNLCKLDVDAPDFKVCILNRGFKVENLRSLAIKGDKVSFYGENIPNILEEIRIHGAKFSYG